MAELKIKAESQPQRCEICHQADCFDPQDNYCSRCSSVIIDDPVSNEPSLQICHIGAGIGAIVGSIGWPYIMILNLTKNDLSHLMGHFFYSIIGGFFFGIIGLILGALISGILFGFVGIFELVNVRIGRPLGVLFVMFISISMGGLLGQFSISFIGSGPICGNNNAIVIGLLTGAIIGGIISTRISGRVNSLCTCRETNFPAEE